MVLTFGEHVDKRHFMETGMTLAIVCYFSAYYYGRRNWKLHLSLAVTGFALDIAATFVMVNIVRGSFSQGLSTWLWVHIILSGLAILLFFLQAWLGYGILKEKEVPKNYFARLNHRQCARMVFLPTWIASAMTGILMIK